MFFFFFLAVSSGCHSQIPQGEYLTEIDLCLKAEQFKIKGPTDLVPGEGPLPRLKIPCQCDFTDRNGRREKEKKRETIFFF